MRLTLVLCLASTSLRPSGASIACPVSLLDGKIEPDAISLSFRNKGKLPLQELDFHCAKAGTARDRQAICHQEPGLFFPGNVYDFDFSYPGKDTRSITLSLQSARFSDGSVWRRSRDQPCRTLKVEKKKTHP